MGLAYATSCRGACQLKAWTVGAEIIGKTHGLFSTEGKTRLVFDLQNRRSVTDSLGVCVISTRVIGLGDMAEMVSMVIGFSFMSRQLEKVGERIHLFLSR